MSSSVVPEILKILLLESFEILGNFESRLIADCKPLPGNPKELINPFCEFNLSILGCAFPGLASLVIVPPVRYPNPNVSKEDSNWQSLSNPAASPMGLVKCIPAKFVSNNSESYSKRFLDIFQMSFLFKANSENF